MGRGKRVQPAKLGAKLLTIRERLDLTQVQIFRRLGVTRSRIYSSHISGYETGTREPPLDVILQYARLAGVPMEVLVDDDLNLPDTLLAENIQEWVMVKRERKLKR